MNPLIALSRIYRELSSVKHVTFDRPRPPQTFRMTVLSAPSEIQTIISEYYCYLTNSKTSWPVLSLSVSVPRSPDWRERVGWRETAQTLGHQEGREDSFYFPFVLHFPLLLFLSKVLFYCFNSVSYLSSSDTMLLQF